VGILLVLVIVTVLAATQRQVEQVFPVLSSLSATPDGALALKLWMEELRYEVKENELASFIPPEEASIILMLEPSPSTEGELQAIDSWVEDGGTLIVIGERYGMLPVLDHFRFSFGYSQDDTSTPAVQTPLLRSPSSFAPKNTKARIVINSERDDYVVLMAHDGKPVLASFDQGRGRVILGTIVDTFTNAGLKKAGNPELVLNILALARNKGAVWLDEWHHGVQGGRQVLGPAAFLRSTPVGRALLFVTFVVFITLFVQGRGFGRPVPLPQEIKRRGALEHVTGIANLSRRAAHRSAVMGHYHDQIKRKLGHRYRLDPGMDDEAYVDALTGYNPSIDKNELLNLLMRLKRREVSESEMVHVAVEAAKWIDN
jgi:hypothetical protein